MKGIKIIAMACVMFVITSCGVLKNKSKHNERLEIKESAKVEVKQSEQTESKTNVSDKEIDKGVIVTERQTTTTTTTEASKGKAVIRKGDLKPGENIIPMDSAVGMIKAVLDTLNKTLTIEVDRPLSKTETVVNERITEHKDLTKEHKEEKKDTSNKQVATMAQNSRDEKIVKQESESKPNILAVIASKIGWGIFAVIVIGFALWYFGIKRKKNA